MTRQIIQKTWGLKIRELITGEQAKDFDKAVDLTVHTKCPEKWLLVDLETGQMYRGMEKPNKWGKWRRLNKKFTVTIDNKQCIDI